jgi:hypothetical protein
MTDYAADMARVYNSCIRTILPIGVFVASFSLILFDIPHTRRDCTIEKIMLDPSNMYPKSFHPSDMWRSKDFRQKAKGYS